MKTVWEKKCEEACRNAGLDVERAFDECYVQYQPYDENYTGELMDVNYPRNGGWGYFDTPIRGHFYYRNKLYFVVKQI